jgi:hypothetical protein
MAKPGSAAEFNAVWKPALTATGAYRPPAPAGGGAPAPAPVAGGGGLTNTAQVNPAMQSWLDRVGTAHTAAAGAGPDPLQQEQVDNLRSRMSSDTTERAIQRAQLATKTQAAGQKRGLQRMLSRNGISGGAEAKLGMNIDAAAARTAAGQAADIAQGAETRLDNLTLGGQGIMSAPGQYRLAQQQVANSLLGLGASTAGNIAQQGLAQQGLGLQQWQAYDQSQRGWAGDARAAEADRIGQMMALWRMMNPNAAA